jgi:hypothetical protein
MKTYLKKLLVGPALLALFTFLDLQPATARAQDTMFTYQERVTDNGTNSITITPPTGNLFFRLKNP